MTPILYPVPMTALADASALKLARDALGLLSPRAMCVYTHVPGQRDAAIENGCGAARFTASLSAIVFTMTSILRRGWPSNFPEVT